MATSFLRYEIPDDTSYPTASPSTTALNASIELQRDFNTQRMPDGKTHFILWGSEQELDNVRKKVAQLLPGFVEVQ